VPDTYTSGLWLVREGQEDAFVAAWKEFTAWAATMPGSGTLRLVRDVDAPRKYMSFAPWDSFESQRAWKATPEFRERMGRVQEHVEEFVPSVYEVVAEVEPAT
jgi:heme-degrading monooxygenase HmoA